MTTSSDNELPEARPRPLRARERFGTPLTGPSGSKPRPSAGNRSGESGPGRLQRCLKPSNPLGSISFRPVPRLHPRRKTASFTP